MSLHRQLLTFAIGLASLGLVLAIAFAEVGDAWALPPCILLGACQFSLFAGRTL